jgi:PD-(D/E)XK endonuclease
MRTPEAAAGSVRVTCEHLFVENPNHKGNVAELAIALSAMKLGLPVYKPLGEHGKTDLVLEIGGRLHRIQCKWGALDSDSSLVIVRISGSRLTPNGYVRTAYGEQEIDFVAVYCGALDRCYLLPKRLVVGRSAVQLRVKPTKNGQRSCINLAADYEFDGAVAQLARASGWQPEGRGFESPQLHLEPPRETIGCDEFRIRLGHYVDLALAGCEVFVTRRGGKRLRFALAAP